jgi:hypothetical protein
MKVVRQWMTKSFILAVPVLGLLSSCNPTEITGTGAKSNIVTNDGTFDNKAYIYPENPVIISGHDVSFTNVNIAKYLDKTPVVITENTRLTGNCTFGVFSGTNAVEECLKVRPNSTSPDIDLARKSDRTYIFTAGTPEFYQVNALYHAQKGVDKFFEKLAFAYDTVYSIPKIPRSIPSYLKDTEMFWLKAVANTESKVFKKSFLTVYSQCEFQANAFFDAAGPSLCLGTLDSAPNFNIVQDPSILYHELGHALVAVMMNLRNGTKDQFGNLSYHPFRTNLGTYGYDEGGSINEGLADYYSFVMRNRETIGEFGLAPLNAVRPLSETAPGHISGISDTSEGRLSYPQYLLYNPNSPDSPEEDVHYAGGIMTHYLVALTKSLKSQCVMPVAPEKAHELATSYVMLLLAETLSELGDLKARGIDMSTGYPYTTANLYFNNLDETNSFLWSQVVNPVTYRRFMQVFSKNIYKYISKNLCTAFDQNDSEKLLDDYGLLLFKTYNNNSNSTKSRTATYSNASGIGTIDAYSTNLVTVSEDNRRKSVLISKQLIDLAAKTDTFPNRVGFYIIDSPTEIQDFLSVLLFKGYTVPLSTNVASTVYNNSNIRVSPGEIVGVIPNLVNNSNSVMAGVKLLANDWDHVHVSDQTTGNFKPCVFDATTTVDQGGEAGNTCATTQMSYNRLIKNASNVFPAEAAAPICLVQLEEGDSTRWVSQNEFRKKQGLTLLDKDCLGYSASGNSDVDFTFNPHECLARFLPGANQASFSKIDPQKTYYETVVKETKAGIFNPGNVMLLEVNKWIPPGTKFRCRMRARFSNCSDCFADSVNSNDDYIDGELNGNKPYKVINFEFDVND